MRTRAELARDVEALPANFFFLRNVYVAITCVRLIQFAPEINHTYRRCYTLLNINRVRACYKLFKYRSTLFFRYYERKLSHRIIKKLFYAHNAMHN